MRAALRCRCPAGSFLGNGPEAFLLLPPIFSSRPALSRAVMKVTKISCLHANRRDLRSLVTAAIYTDTKARELRNWRRECGSKVARINLMRTKVFENRKV